MMELGAKAFGFGGVAVPDSILKKAIRLLNRRQSSCLAGALPSDAILQRQALKRIAICFNPCKRR